MEERKVMNFLDLGLSEKTVKAINEWGIEKPTAVQADVIPAILQGKDVFTIAPGGCGKTISYVLPLLDVINRKDAQNILIMTSDPRKSVIISDNLATLNRFHEESDSENDNNEKEADVIIGSPDLLLDLVAEQNIDLSKINVFIVDDINLIKKNKQIENMEKILEMLPTDKQNIVYTTRRSRETQYILDKILKAPQEVKVKATDACIPHETRAPARKHKKTETNTENCEQQDQEAWALVKKHNSFKGKTPAFLLSKVQLVESE